MHLLNLDMAALLADEDGLPGSHVGLGGAGDDAGDADELTYQVALEIADHLRVLIGVDLHLELGSGLHVWVGLVIVVSLVDGFHGCLEYLDVLLGTVPESCGQPIVEGNEVLHVDSQVVVASLGVVLELFSVDVSIANLGFSHKMHEFVLSFDQAEVFIHGVWVIARNQILISVVNGFSLKTHIKVL